MSDSLWPHGLQHTRLPCPSLSPGVCSNSSPLSWWCHSTILSCCPLLLPPSIFPSIRDFSNESALHIRWPKYWSFSLTSVPPMNIQVWSSAVQETLNNLLQHHCSKASTLRCSAFFMVQLLYQYMITGKTIALTIWTFASKVMCVLFNMCLGLS